MISLHFVFLGVIGHTGYNGCIYCKQKGFYYKNRIVYETTINQLRTDSEFRTYVDKSFHLGHNPFKDCLFIKDIPLAFPPEAMHLVDLGVVMKTFCCIKEMKKLSVPKANEILANIKKYVPEDFARQPRTIDDMERYKATEWRLFGLYIGPVILYYACKDVNIILHYLNLFIAYRILHGVNGIVTDDNIKIAQNLIENFVSDYPKIYGKEKVSSNIHVLLHLTSFVKMYGPVDNFTAYEFENFYQLLRKWIRKASDYFNQIYTRWWQSNGIITRKTSKPFGSFVLRANTKDSCIMLQNGQIGLIVKKVDGGLKFQCKIYKNVENFFMLPIESSNLNIFKVSDLGPDIFLIDLKCIKTKMFRMPFDGNYVVMPILHNNI